MSFGRKLAAIAANMLGWREDAHETAVLARQLDYVQAQVYRTEYSELKALQFIPEASDVPVGAKTFTYRVWDRFGMAKVIKDYANDFEAVGVLAKEVTQKTVDLGDFYEYSLTDLEHAAFTNTPLSTELADAARLAMDLAMDNILSLGDPDTGLPGFVNFGNVPIATLPNGDWRNPSTTAMEKLADLRYLASVPVINTKELHKPDTLLLDTESYEDVAGTPVSDNAPDKTILSVFLATNPHIRYVDQWGKLDTANADGDGPRIMVYQRDPRVVQAQIPRKFTQLPMQQVAAMFRTYCMAKLGGVSWRYPLAAAYADNVKA